MRAGDHPDYPEEREYLDRTVNTIRNLLAPYLTPRRVEAADAEAAAAVARLLTDRMRRLRDVSPEPYFGRFDFKRAGSDTTRKTYIGREGVPSPNGGPDMVYDWRAPIAALFYASDFFGISYVAPNGAISGDIALRRQFRITEGRLIEISDKRPVEEAATLASSVARPNQKQPPVESDEFLLRVLAERRDAGLRDIVATIQAQQNALIRAALDQVLIIQGVAGSGKTSVALHRVAYLLYTYRDTLPANRIIVFGPSRLFLRSIAEVLPGLGVQDIRQTTFEEWATTWISESLKFDRSDQALERFLDRHTDRHTNIALYLRGRLKGSLRIAGLLAAHVRQMRRASIDRAGPISVTYRNPTGNENTDLGYVHVGTEVPIELTANEVREAIQRSAVLDDRGQQPLNVCRGECLRLLQHAAWRKFSADPRSERAGSVESVGERATREHAFKTTIASGLDSRLRKFWPVHTAQACYRALLADKALLDEANAEMLRSQGLELSDSELGLLHVPKTGQTDHEWAIEDVPVLCFLELLLNGRTLPLFRHIVVDEAQDMSPLQIEVLRRHVEGNSITLLGDIAQGIYSYRGIQKWSEVRDVFRRARTATAKLAISYRSTYEIIALASGVLERARLPEKVTALAVERHGETPTLQRYASWPAMANGAVLAVIRSIEQGSRSVAIIGKTATICRQFMNVADVSALPGLTLVLDRDSLVTTTAVVMPAYLAKGMEFDCVVLIGADKDTFTESEYDAKLLYVALTRALHELHVYWVGHVASLLKPAAAVMTAR